MPAEAFELGRRLFFLQSCCMPVTGCQASLFFCNRRGITVHWEGNLLPLLKRRRTLATGRCFWTLWETLRILLRLHVVRFKT